MTPENNPRHQAETTGEGSVFIEVIDYPHEITEEERNRPRIRPPHALYYMLGLDKLNPDAPPESPPTTDAGT